MMASCTGGALAKAMTLAFLGACCLGLIGFIGFIGFRA